jgi:hypothetical protein
MRPEAIEYGDQIADYFVITDAEYTYPAKNVQEMIQILGKNPQVSMVCSNRFNGHTLEGVKTIQYRGRLDEKKLKPKHVAEILKRILF